MNCVENGRFCGKCCFDTEMPLTEEDLRRIEGLGYVKDEFSIRDGETRRLRNVNGRCYFLDDENRCVIYEHRPEGCRLYPAVFDGEKVVVDKICPKWREVKVCEGAKKRLLRLIERVYGFDVF